MGKASRPISRARREVEADVGAPDWIACRTLRRILRRVDEPALATRTIRTGRPAIIRCQGFVAIVGVPSMVVPLDAASRGASTPRSPDDDALA